MNCVGDHGGVTGVLFVKGSRVLLLVERLDVIHRTEGEVEHRVDEQRDEILAEEDHVPRTLRAQVVEKQFALVRQAVGGQTIRI